MTLGVALMGWFVLVLVVVPPPAFLIALVMATGSQSIKRRLIAWVFGLLSLVSVALVVWFIHDFNHAFDGD